MRTNPKCPKMCSLSAEIIGGNEDLLGKIFVDVPVRSLTRFKSVSKQWLALISNPQFRLRHTLGNPSSCIPSGLFLYNPINYKDDTIHSISLSKFGGKIPSCSDPIELPDDLPIELVNLFPKDRNVMRMVQSCNGLNLYRFNTFNNQMESFCIRNLVTNQLKFVPLPKVKEYEWITSCILAFDPPVSPYYKLICVKGMNPIGSKILIFSSENGEWRDTNVTMDDHKLEYAIGAYCHGAIYWIRRGRPAKLSCYRFDIEAEILTEISMPPTAYSTNFRHFRESYGHLYLVFVHGQEVFNVFELDQVTMKWFIKHRVHVNHLICSLPQDVMKGENSTSGYTFSVLSVVNGEKEKDSALVVKISDKVILYNFKSKKGEVLLSELKWKKQSSFRRVQYVFRSPMTYAYPFIATLYHLE